MERINRWVIWIGASVAVLGLGTICWQVLFGPARPAPPPEGLVLFLGGVAIMVVIPLVLSVAMHRTGDGSLTGNYSCAKPAEPFNFIRAVRGGRSMFTTRNGYRATITDVRDDKLFGAIEGRGACCWTRDGSHFGGSCELDLVPPE